MFRMLVAHYCLLLPPLLLGAGTISGDRARAVLEEGASEGEPESRRAVAVAMSIANSQLFVDDLLAKLATDKDVLVREAALTTLGELGSRRNLAAVKAGLEDDVPEVVFAAARSYYKLDRVEGTRVLLSILEKETAAESGFMREKMRGVARRLKSPRSALLFGLQQSVGLVPIPGMGSGFSAVSAMLLDADLSPRALALTLASSNRSPEVRKAVLAALSDDDWSVRAAAVQTLAGWNEAASRRNLAPLIEDKNRKVRYRAAAAYLRLESLGRAR